MFVGFGVAVGVAWPGAFGDWAGCVFGDGDVRAGLGVVCDAVAVEGVVGEDWGSFVFVGPGVDLLYEFGYFVFLVVAAAGFWSAAVDFPVARGDAVDVFVG